MTVWHGGVFFVVFKDFQFSKKMVIIVQRKEETSRNFIYLSTPLPLVHGLFSVALHSARSTE